jgi:hypothetical protein
MPDSTNEQDRHDAPLNGTEDRAPSRRNILLGSSALVAAATMTSGALAQAQKAAPAPASSSGRKPNILMITADDIGWFNVSAYNLGVMGYRTPNIDPTSTASPTRARCSPTGTASRVALRGAPPSSPDNHQSGPASPRWVSPARTSDFTPKT